MAESSKGWVATLIRQSTVRPVAVLLACVALVGLVNVTVPQLEAVMAQDSTPVVPTHAPAVQALEHMDREFGNGRSRGTVFLVIERAGGLQRGDRAYLRTLLTTLGADRENVSAVQDVFQNKEVLAAVTSKDGEAIYVQVGLPGDVGAPTALGQIEAVRHHAQATRPEGLQVAVTGPAATIADMSTEIEHSILTITFVTVGLIAVILLMIYRSLSVTALILGFIGVALAAARAAAALLGGHVFDVSTFTASFLTAVVLGAATDYAVFLVSRFQELRREGMDAGAATVAACTRIAPVVIGSALTVVLANACMAIADVGIYRTTGPAIAAGILVTLALSLTLMPALIALTGARGWLDPRPRAAGSNHWQRIAAGVTRRPARVLAMGLAPLIALACFFPLLQPNFDEAVVQPDDTESNTGYALLGRHFPLNETLPDYVVVSADHDLRNAKDLAALEQMSSEISHLDGVVSVRGVTRPLGTTITEASMGYQSERVGSRLDEAGEQVRAGEADSKRLTDGAGEVTDGADQLADGTTRLARGADQAVDGAGRLLTGVRQLEAGITQLADGTGQAATGIKELRTGADQLATGLELAHTQTTTAVNGLGLAYQALQRSLPCSIDIVCNRARDGVRQVYEGERDQLLPGLKQAATAARQIADGTIDLQTGLTRLDAGLTRAEQGVARLETGSATMRTKLGQLSTGAGKVAEGSRKVAEGSEQVRDGTQQASESVAELSGGLEQAARYLRTNGRAARDPAVGGFYLPPSALKSPRFALSSGMFLSPDGKTARFVVLGDTGAFERSALDRSGEVDRAAERGLRGTRLEDAAVATTGVAATMADLERINRVDFRLVALVALLGVFLILLWLLRSVVAAGFLLASVALSYAAAVGLGVLVWQLLLDQPLDWSVPTIAFILLVAVGADYNLLLMKRMLEEAPDGSRAGIARAVSATGGVITAAGVIFAASLFAMMAGSVLTLAQIGSTIGIGLLIDTFVVRTLVVPAGATLLGRHLWWPRTTPPAEPA